MKDYRKKIGRFLGLVILGCYISICTKYMHELSCKDWTEHIVVAIVFAIGFLLIEYFYTDKKGNE
jgi:hypothetical protein